MLKTGSRVRIIIKIKSNQNFQTRFTQSPLHKNVIEL